MAAFEFEFNQAQVEKVVKSTLGGNDLHIAIFGHKDKGDLIGQLYLGLQSCDPTTGNPDKSLPPAVGCPVPPGWSGGATFPGITHDELVNCPKFVVLQKDKSSLLTNNFPPSPAKEKLITVILESSQIDANLKIKASFKIKDASGTTTSTIDADVK